jgi:hypothetical protein
VVINRYNDCVSRNDSPCKGSVQIFDDHHHPHRTTTQSLRTEVEVLSRLASDPELGGLDGQPSDHCDGVAIQAEQLSGGGTECRLLNLSALKGEDSQATLRITTLTLAPEGSHRPHASGFQTGTNPITAALYVLRLQVQLKLRIANLPGSCLAGSVPSGSLYTAYISALRGGVLRR